MDEIRKVPLANAIDWLCPDVGDIAGLRRGVDGKLWLVIDSPAVVKEYRVERGADGSPVVLMPSEATR